MQKATYDGLTRRTWIDGESVDGTPLLKSRDTAAAELREGASRAGFGKSAGGFNYSSPDSGYGEMIKEWTLTSPTCAGTCPT